MCIFTWGDDMRGIKRARAYSTAGTHTHLGMHTAQCMPAEGLGNKKRDRENPCVHMLVLPEVSPLSSGLIPFLAATVEK